LALASWTQSVTKRRKSTTVGRGKSSKADQCIVRNGGNKKFKESGK